MENDSPGYYGGLQKLYYEDDILGAIHVFNQVIRENPKDSKSFHYRGEAFRLKGELDAALNDYNQAVHLDPSPENYCGRGWVFLEKNDPDAALRDFDEAIKRSPKNVKITCSPKPNGDVWCGRGKAFGKKGKLSDALSSFTEAINRDPNEPEFYKCRSLVYKHQGNYVASQSDLDYAKHLESRNHFEFGRQFSSSGNFKAAVQAFNNAIQLDGHFFEANIECGIANSEIGNYDVAFNNFSNAIQIDPKNARSYYYRGQTYLKAGEIDAAIEDFGKAIQLDQRNANYFFASGTAYQSKGNSNAAIQDFNQTIQLDPQYIEAYFQRGMIFTEKGQWDDAIEDFSKVIHLNPNNISAYFVRGYIYFQICNLDAALRDVNNVISLDSENVESFISRGDIYLKLGKWDSAIRDFKKVLSLNPDDQDVEHCYLNLSCAYLAINEFDSAINYCNKVLGLDTQNFIAYNNRGYAYALQGNLEDAIKDCNKSIQINPKYANSYDSRGFAYLRQGILDKAIQDFNKAIDLNPFDSSQVQHRGEAYKQLGDLQAANRDLKKAAQMQKEDPTAFLYNPDYPDNKEIEKNKENHLLTETSQCKDQQNIEQLFDELKGLIGLGQVKADVEQLMDFIKVQSLRKEKGLKGSDLSLHAVFYGSPGTGKTTVARIYGKMLHALGLLENGQIVETDRSGLVANYVGQTTTKTMEKINSAIGGVLFIDEAYSLYKGKNTEWDYGAEAIDTLIKQMEDNRDNLAVIVAGYPEPMDDFLNSNEGFKSRFVNYIHFEDYTPEELMNIFLSFCEQDNYSLGSGVPEVLEIKIKEDYEKRDKSFGNARYCRNLFQKVRLNQAMRITAKYANPNKEQLCIIEAEDIAKLLKKPVTT
jgi:tetratricopeptide (TPR) repeat protein